MYTRKTLAGEFIVVNKKLVEMLERTMERGSQEGDYHQRGSIKGIDLIPVEIQKLFQTVWDLKQKILLQHARTRAPYVCRPRA
jgi:ribonucleoside-diphosphate reductase alpha chain/ribonucleoside-diphosphate reductase subunit M1